MLKLKKQSSSGLFKEASAGGLRLLRRVSWLPNWVKIGCWWVTRSSPSFCAVVRQTVLRLRYEHYRDVPCCYCEIVGVQGYEKYIVICAGLTIVCVMPCIKCSKPCSPAGNTFSRLSLDWSLGLRHCRSSSRSGLHRGSWGLPMILREQG